MRKDLIVCYDISDETRLRKVYKIMCGYGEWLQYSVFRCELSERQRFKLMGLLQQVINNWEDQVLFIDLGPSEGRTQRFETLGRPYASPPPRRTIIL